MASRPLAARLLDQSLVLWRDAAGAIKAWSDQCPHRGASLALGRVVNDRLVCAYHGWGFDGNGQCRGIPATPGLVPGAAYRACTFEVQEAYGLIWVRLQAPLQAHPVHDLPAFQAEHDPQLRKLNCGPYRVNSSAPRVVENFLDLAHFGFVHDGLLGSKDAAEVEPYDVATTPHGLRATGCKAVQPRASMNAVQPAEIAYSYEVTAPFAAVLTKALEPPVAAQTKADAIALFINPETPETCVVWIRLAVNDTASTDEELAAFQDTIFAQDLLIVQSQRPKRLPLAPGAELNGAADRTSAAYRRFLSQTGIGFGVTGHP